jgi:hypothetical protein
VKSFVQKLAGLVFGVLNSFDRLMFRGHLRELAYLDGMHRSRNFNGVKVTAFGKHAEPLTDSSPAACRPGFRSRSRSG